MGHFLWERHKDSEQWVLDLLKQSMKDFPALKRFEERLHAFTSSPLLAWVDSLIVPGTKAYKKRLEEEGYRVFKKEKEGAVYRHPGAQLPSIYFSPASKTLEVVTKVEALSDFLLANAISSEIEGTPWSPQRRALISSGKHAKWWAVERRGSVGFRPISERSSKSLLCIQAKEAWMTRSRHSRGFEAAFEWVDTFADRLGKDRAACIVLAAERTYWQMKNRAGQVQKNRQDRLGLGWANHDHHTFRSSRSNLYRLVQFFEKLGFHCRERFYAGEEAGWGAQVMENPKAQLVLFLDVDLSPEEIAVDFAHDVLKERLALGTIGLWCALHGDSFLEAGMHHLEAQFSFESLRDDLKSLGVPMMPPFSDFPFLRQAFTQGEMWPVRKEKVETLLKKKQLSAEQAKQFLKIGALGSHLENLERKEGYKGFNQKNVSSIIKKTDPRQGYW